MFLFCIDYHRLNEARTKYTYLLLRIKKCINFLGTAKLFTALDADSGYLRLFYAGRRLRQNSFCKRCCIIPLYTNEVWVNQCSSNISKNKKRHFIWFWMKNMFSKFQWCYWFLEHSGRTALSQCINSVHFRKSSCVVRGISVWVILRYGHISWTHCDAWKSQNKRLCNWVVEWGLATAQQTRPTFYSRVV